jgi:hypothetical protein
MEWLAREKQSNLLNYGHKKLYNIGPGRQKHPKKLGLPKVLPDLPSVSQLLARRKAANSSRFDFI